MRVGVGGIRERVVEREERRARVGGDFGDQRVEAPDPVGRPLVSVVPRQHVGDGERQPRRATALEHRLEVAPSFFHGSPLHDVVDAALHDERVGAGQDEVEPARDLIRALA